MIWTLIAIYLVISVVVFFVIPYRDDVPKEDLIAISVFWLPSFIILLLIGLKK